MGFRSLLTVVCSLIALSPQSCRAYSAQVPLQDLGLNSIGTTNNETNIAAGGCGEACALLESTFGPDQVISMQSNSASYSHYTSSYWSVFQSEATPSCIFKPKTAEELGAQVRISRDHQCPFAARSGGHSRFAYSSSSPGITISLEHFNQVDVDSVAGTANVGPGNRWVDVYAALQPHNLVVIGGRVAAIGVGGFTTGGGISHFANQHGWACDNVVSYTVVTADGSVQKASSDTNPDLFWALRGGGPNFGIVINFELKTHPLPDGLIWSGGVMHPEANFPALTKAFVNSGTRLDADPKASQILSFAAVQGQRLALAYFSYTEPTANASVFDEYLAIEGSLTGNGDLFVRTLVNATVEMERDSPHGFRQTYWTGTYRLTLEMATYIREKLFEATKPIQDVEELLAACSLQHVSMRQVSQMGAHGGNPLGLDLEKAPFMLIVCSARWMHPADDTRIMTVYHGLMEELKTYAKEKGMFEEFLYMNYASEYQDVISGYGKENKQRLQRIASKYDPDRVFQKLGPGYFKLDGPPAKWPSTYG